jgi:hypothetical protein
MLNYSLFGAVLNGASNRNRTGKTIAGRQILLTTIVFTTGLVVSQRCTRYTLDTPGYVCGLDYVGNHF